MSLQVLEPASTSDDCTPDRIASLANDLSAQIKEAVLQIKKLTSQSRLLSFNAQIEAARSGKAGSTFSVVALAMRDLSTATEEIAKNVHDGTLGIATHLQSIGQALGSTVRGTRLGDLALTNIDLIDRNLYERSCDCRWWATDSSFVDALERKTPEAIQFASQRMGVILKAYTVYLDLVLAGPDGRVIANGRPNEYPSVGINQSKATWFCSAMNTHDGDAFGFEPLSESVLANTQRCLIYSAGVRSGGLSNGRVIGALGLVFNWDALAQTIVDNTPLAAGEKERTRVVICDEQGLILADTGRQQLRQSLDLTAIGAAFGAGQNYATVYLDGKEHIVGRARSPGFETYATGWWSYIIQRV
jgi:hypothetical protein